EEHIRAAKQTGADAIHPGYGFLAENPDFAEAVEASGLVFVGPTAEGLRTGGDKLAAKEIARRVGVPVIEEGDPSELGFPLVIKAAAGGGGRGMRIVRDPAELDDVLAAARREAKAAFGDDRVFCERYVERPRHVEIQLLADGSGNVVSLGERECSIQRRHQKVLEESPSHAVEVRLYAEDPLSFLPQAGRLERLRLPTGIRVDAGVEEGDEVGTAYDPMIAKLIAHGRSRDEALDRLAAALDETEVAGVTTNLPFLRWLVRHPDVRAGETTTAFLPEPPP